jgi:hypothetical protein
MINIDLLIDKIKYFYNLSVETENSPLNDLTKPINLTELIDLTKPINLTKPIEIHHAICAILDLYPEDAEKYIERSYDYVNNKEKYADKLDKMPNNDHIFKIVRLVNLGRGTEELMFFLFGLFL